MQGILASGVAYYMQVWVIDKSGPVFLAMTMPITLLVTLILSLFLGEAVTVGRWVCPSGYQFLALIFHVIMKMIYDYIFTWKSSFFPAVS
jgi:drug/metabolite transporter (DMT)-like permease